MPEKIVLLNELVEVLNHWKVARGRLDKSEKAENLRCAVDIVALLNKSGVEVDKSVYD